MRRDLNGKVLAIGTSYSETVGSLMAASHANSVVLNGVRSCQDSRISMTQPLMTPNGLLDRTNTRRKVNCPPVRPQ